MFKNYVAWYGDEDSPINSEPHIRKWLLERLPYEVSKTNDDQVDLRDIGMLTIGKWSAYSSRDLANTAHYFFQLEEDAVAFKLRWF